MLDIFDTSKAIFNNLVYLSQPHSIISRPFPEKYEERIKYRYSMDTSYDAERFLLYVVSIRLYFGELFLAKATQRCTN